MGKNLIMVGMGDYWKSIAKATLQTMETESLTHLLSTVDIKPREEEEIFPAEHRIRASDQLLSALLADLKDQDPVVILGHANDLLTPDAQDLAEHGFSVLVEKPYAINQEQLQVLKSVIAENPTKISLAEYYLTMKAVPLLVAAGKIKRESFYFAKDGLLKAHEGLPSFATTPQNLAGKLQECVGKPTYIYSDILEGEGNTGKVSHRGIALVDITRGGGMLQDLGVHALSPLVALEDYIGQIDPNFYEGKVKTALCDEYQAWAAHHFGLDEKNIGESYAELSFATSSGVLIKVAVGKYVLKQRNQRRIVIVGDEGQAMLDMSRCVLHLSYGDDSFKKVLEAPKLPASKYYSVIRSGLELLYRKNPFTFDAASIALKAQEITLSAVEKASHQKTRSFYKSESLPRDIFS